MDRQILGDSMLRFIGTALTLSGGYGLVNPLQMNKMFGVPTATAETALMYPGIGGRNLSAGLAVWALSLAGHRRPLGILVSIWGVCTGLADTSICLKTKNNRAAHLINIMVLCTTGLLATQDFEGEASYLLWVVAAAFGGSILRTIFQG